jgi:hypothetical protein
MTKKFSGYGRNLKELMVTASQIDWHKLGLQCLESSFKNSCIHVRHEIEAIHLEFEGFGDLFGYEAFLYWEYRRAGRVEQHVLASNFVGINNIVCLHYEEFLPQNGVKLSVMPTMEPS